MINEIGSIWRKWDLHIHTPKTKMEDNFRIEGDSNDTEIWKLYCEKLNDYGASVLGITDYFSVENYHYLLDNREKLGLDDEIVLFPNIELRVSDLTSGNPNSKVNLHIIFDNKSPISDINRFFSKLEVERGNGQILNFLDDFEEIFDGTHIEYLPTSSDVITALKSGIGTNYKEKVLIMIPNGDDGISPNPRHGFGRNKDFICKHVDLINTANPTDISFYLERAKDDLGRQYPCVSGCDAHSFERITGYPKEKVTWIKADTTFEGLKSITLEPEFRVHIGETPPDLKADRKILNSLTIKHGDFGEQTIHFNPHLNTIIGGRSSGKSLLLSILAHKASGETELKKGNNSYNDLILDYTQDH